MLVTLVAMRRLREGPLGSGDSEECVGHEDAVNNKTVPAPVSKNNKKDSGASFKRKTEKKGHKVTSEYFKKDKNIKTQRNKYHAGQTKNTLQFDRTEMSWSFLDENGFSSVTNRRQCEVAPLKMMKKNLMRQK
ncbi:hypothetical protein NDU88_009551 [Pleurodeles waltl]|uniref:Uncharacterized protein n=1 Tax=Pleurodeles waltl TaxID=8319 RepID=A0AAV7PVA0_PLEWA|nr:hypothetical protein NDU88_009551 [Pleurodeles waltl]